MNARTNFRWSLVLLQLVDLGVAAVLLIAPLFMGGRGPVGRLVLLSLIGFTVLAWLTRQCLLERPTWRRSGVEWLLVAGLLLVGSQLLPLPTTLRNRVSPEIGKLLPLWSAANAPARLGAWSTTSLTPEDTRGGLAMYTGYALLFLVLVQRIERERDVEQLLRTLAIAAVGMAVIGLLQLTLGNGRFLWLYEHPYRDTIGKANGTFSNQNHFAQFLALGLGPLIWWFQRAGNGEETRDAFGAKRRGSWDSLLKPGLAIGIALVCVAVLLTFSRGGVLALATAVGVCLGLYLKQRLVGARLALGAAGLAAVIVAALSIYGYERLEARLSRMASSRSLSELDAIRQQLWKAHLQAVPKFWLTGTGVGSHKEIYPTYFPENPGVELTHGENSYLQLLLETGVPGLALMLLGFGTCVVWGLSCLGDDDVRRAAFAAPILAGIAASLVQSLGDFLWYIPACVSPLVVLAACLCRLRQLRRGLEKRANDGGEAGRYAAVVGLAGAMFVTVLMVRQYVGPARAEPHWDEYLKLALAQRDQLVQQADANLETVSRLEEHLSEILTQNPRDARAHLRLANMRLRRFDLLQQRTDNPMSVQQIRDGALASQFPSRADQDAWLARVSGDNRRLLDASLRHTRRALQLCPLQGDGYIYLAELTFLEGHASTKAPYVEQALVVRPYDGVVLMAAGSEAALAGNVMAALAYWKRAFHLDRDQQGRIIELLGPQLPPDVFLQQFEPTWEGLGRLFTFYLNRQQTPAARVVAVRYVDALRERAQAATDREASDLWRTTHGVYEFLGDGRLALECARRAVATAPEEYAAHELLARSLVRMQQFDAAIDELKWCVSRNPSDAALNEQLKQVTRQRLEMSRQPVGGALR